MIDDTHDPSLQSWVESANPAGADFPLQNLPFGRFRQDGDADWRIGVAIGEQVLGLRQAGLAHTDDMRHFLGLAPPARRELRRAISHGLRRGSPREASLRQALLPQAGVQMGLPCEIGNFTDFYSGIHHARAVGTLFRPGEPLLPNYKWLPQAYHGRASTIGASPSRFHRPQGQQRGAGATRPVLGPSTRLDYELEVGFVVGRASTQGEPVSIDHAEDHLFGVVLLNDWSARDIQAWEAQPLGPFASKNFASTVSPWIVTMEALAPFRRPFGRPAGDPEPLPYLDSPANRAQGAIDITLQAWLQTAAMREAGLAAQRLSESNLTDAYWSAAQLVAHHTVNGCSLCSGDLLGSGTMSGPTPEQAGSLLELTQGGRTTLALSSGEARGFLQDGDTVVLRGLCSRPGWRQIGLGECRGTVLPARDAGGGLAQRGAVAS